MSKLRNPVAPLIFWSAAAALTALGGCAKPTVNIPTSSAPLVGYDEGVRRIRKDPIAFLRESLAETQKLTEYTVHFQRQERLGLLKQLNPLENISAEFREDPFSVRFTWLDSESEFIQCVYVKGANGNKVVLLPRKGALGPPKPVSYPPSFAVLFQKARNPITDFGARRMMERIIDRIEKAQKKGEVKITLLDPTEMGPSKDPCYQLELRYPPGDPYPCKLQDLYIHTKTLLPVATYLWLPGKVERTEDTLDAIYQYSNLNPAVQLTDANFVIDAKMAAAITGDSRTAAGEGNADGSGDTTLTNHGSQ